MSMTVSWLDDTIEQSMVYSIYPIGTLHLPEGRVVAVADGGEERRVID